MPYVYPEFDLEKQARPGIKQQFGKIIQTAVGLVLHGNKHENGEADEITVLGLSGLLADDQHVLDAEVTAVAIAHALATAANDFLVASGSGTYVKKTLAETLVILGKAVASGLASLDGSSLVVQNPANATATPTAAKIPIADAGGKLDSWVTGGGLGDMTKAVYDSNADGVIAKAQLDAALANTSGTNTGDQTLVGLGGIASALFDAQTILAAVSDNTPAALTVGEQTLVGRITGGNIAALSNTQLAAFFKLLGLHYSLACTYIDGTGTAGTDANPQTVKSITLPANSITQVGDRVRVRAYWRGDDGTAITGTTTVNGVTVSHSTDVGGTSFFINEVYLHYVDNTHANIIETENGALGDLSAANVAGFDWDSNQTINIDQTNSANNHIVVIAIIVDVFPKGII